MEILAVTDSPQILLNAIIKGVVDKNLKTWVIVKDYSGEEFLTHTPGQWFEKALLDFSIIIGGLVIKVTWYDNQEPTEDIKGYYIGRFTEVLMVHFKNLFINLEIHS